MTTLTFTIPKSLSPSCNRPLTPMDSPQDLPLMRADVGSCPLGTKGNLRYTTREGGTARARRVGVLLSEMRRSLADRWAGLKANFTRFICRSSEPRAQREKLVEARVEARSNSSRIGDLLGSLTAKVNEMGRFANANECPGIAQALIDLNVPSEGNLYALKGAKYCLDTYLGELKEADLVALSRGVLSNEEACKAVLDRTSTRPDDPLRMQASQVPGDIAEAVNQRVLRYTGHGPLLKFVELLAADPVNEQDLREQLLMITKDWKTMTSYFRSLSTDEFKVLLDTLQSKNLKNFPEAIVQTGSFYSLLSELDSEFIFIRAPRSLMDEQENLDWALRAGNGLDVSEALYRLSLAVEDTCRVWEVLPDETIESVQQLVEQSMDLFRDQQNNPDGPLNWHSLGKLDGKTRENLIAAALVLGRFGLELGVDPDLRDS